MLAVAVAAATTLVEWDLDEDDGGFTAEGDAGAWTWGSVGNGPLSGFDGPGAWSTGLLADYLNDTTDTLEVPIPDLGATSRPALTFAHWYAIAHGDAAWIEVDTGNGWGRVDPIYGYPDEGGWTASSGGWERVGVSLAGMGATPRFRFVFATDDAGVDDGWFIDSVGVYDGDVTAPHVLSVTDLADTEDVEGPYVVDLEAEDDVGITVATLHWDAGAGETVVGMEGSGGSWSASIPGQSPGTSVGYRLTVGDGVNTAAWPASGEETFRVYLPAPTDLAGPEGRVVGTDATLTWSAPVSRHTREGYRVYRDGVAVAETAEEGMEVRLTGEGDVFTVTALFDVGESDPSDPFDVDAVVPVVEGMEPTEGFPGESLRLRLHGEYLLLADGEVTFDMGQGIVVVGVDVEDVDQARIDVAIAADAVPGTRDVTLTSAAGTVDGYNLFTVRDETDRPRLLEVDPATVRQGERTTLTVAYVGDLGPDLAVEAGEGVVIEAASVEDGALSVEVAVAADATLGDHALTVDDGVRRLSGVSVTVRDAMRTQKNGCATGPAASPLALALALLLLPRRRMR